MTSGEEVLFMAWAQPKSTVYKAKVIFNRNVRQRMEADYNLERRFHRGEREGSPGREGRRGTGTGTGTRTVPRFVGRKCSSVLM